MRLIDADALRCKIMQEYDDCTDLLDIIDEQPNAYDVDKVVERLHYAKNPYSDIDLRQYNNALDFAIVVVKRGGN